MSNIERFILENRHHLETQELPDGHEIRFMAKARYKSRRATLRTYIMAAATVTIVLALTGAISLYYNYQFGRDLANYFNSSQTKQLSEVEAYYRSQLLRKYRSIEKIAQADDKPLPSPEQLFGETLADKPLLRAELLSNLRNEVVVGAIVQSYQIRLENLERLEQTISQTNNNK